MISTSVYIKKTENRENYWLAQTPQMFKLELLLDVFQGKRFHLQMKPLQLRA